MSTTITFGLTNVYDAVQPVVDALDDILRSTVVPLQNQLACTKTVTVNFSPTGQQIPTSVVYTFPSQIALDQIANFYRRAQLEVGLTGTKKTETLPASVAISPTGNNMNAYATTDHAAASQPV
jgi:hypothetical protein